MSFQLRRTPYISPKTRHVNVVLDYLPTWYQHTDMYTECIARGMVDVQVPIDCAFTKPTLQSTHDLVELLRAMVYWRFRFDSAPTPVLVYDYCASPTTEVGTMFTGYLIRLFPSLVGTPILYEIYAISYFMMGMRGTSTGHNDVRCYTAQMLQSIMIAGVPVIRYLHTTFRLIRSARQSWMIAAAKFGKIDRIKCLVELQYLVTDAAVNIARKHGHPDCVAYLQPIAEASRKYTHLKTKLT